MWMDIGNTEMPNGVDKVTSTDVKDDVDMKLRIEAWRKAQTAGSSVS